MSNQKFSQLYADDDFMTAFDLMNQGAVELTIERIEKPKGLKILGRPIDKPVIYFKGIKKGWVCPKTKMMQLIQRFKPDAKSPADLVGVKVKIKCDMNAKNPAYPGGKGPAIVVANS